MPENRARRRHAGLLVAALLALLGFAMTVQINQVETDTFAVRGTELVELLKSLDAANARLDDEIADLRRTKSELANSPELSAAARKEAQRRADELAILIGSAPAKGPGIVLTINDPSALMNASQMLDIIEEMRDAGAEVISINGKVRVVAQTFFVDDDAEIVASGIRLTAPYTIEAIGDSAVLSGAMRFRGGVIDGLEERGVNVGLAVRDELVITTLADLKEPEYARDESH